MISVGQKVLGFPFFEMHRLTHEANASAQQPNHGGFLKTRVRERTMFVTLRNARSEQKYIVSVFSIHQYPYEGRTAR